MKKNYYLLLIITILAVSTVNAITYDKITGDSLFVRGVNFEKSSINGTYYANIKVDLSYKDYANPLNRYQSVVQYKWNNWWNSEIDWRAFGVGTLGAVYNNSAGEVFNLNLLDYYYEIPDTDEESCYYDYDQNKVVCSKPVPQTRQGYYGLPFYIQQIEFYCDINDKTKGYSLIIPEATYKDTYDLTRPAYNGVSGPDVTVETTTVPLGWGVIGKMVRTPPLTVQTCTRMTTTNNAQLNVLLRPNPYYRHTNPLTTGSDSWSYSDIINLGTSLTNKDDLSLGMNIYFNYTGNWWNYTITNNQSSLEAGVISGNSDYNDMDCVVDPQVYSSLPSWLQNIITATGFNVATFQEKKKYSELPDQLKGLVNTGQGVVCSYGQSAFVGGYTSNNDLVGGAGKVEDALAVYRQQEIAYKLDLLEKKLETKKFFAKTIIPFFAFCLILMFYIFEIAVLGFVLFALVPIMFKQFLKGIKDSFDLSELKMRRK